MEYLSTIAQAVESKTVIDQYRDQLLIVYMKEMGDMLKGGPKVSTSFHRWIIFMTNLYKTT